MKEDFVLVSGIIEESVVDGPGYRFTVFTQGCPHSCPGCHNPQTHSLDGGTLVNINQLFTSFQKNPLLRGITLSGGEPFIQAEVASKLAKMAHGLGKDVVTYTGYVYEYLVAGASKENGWQKLLDETDYLIDGPFLIKQKSLTLKFRGSKNQRIIDMKATRLAGRVVTVENF
ncbi:anaerobic ribonucleoside-triphosphate reductase activating protein [Elusimicrobium simillimum]|uniref:anaerobic ribonucleoside-triphosphate reductase activating protein n=1 Tax=Elusimicrobium simillimum TaxID=3143438 RepID=UPI003C6F5A6E